MDHTDGLFLWKTPSRRHLDPVIEASASHQFHDDVVIVFIFKQVVYAHYVRMSYLLDYLEFIFIQLLKILSFYVSFAERFDGTRHPRSGRSTRKDFTECSRADEVNHSVIFTDVIHTLELHLGLKR